MALSGLILTGLTILLIAFTPLREYIPGYSSTALKKQAVELNYKTDSLQQVIALNEKYYQSIKKVLKGEVETVEFNRDSIISAAKIEVSQSGLDPIKEDSILRAKVDKEDKYNLFETATSQASFVLFPPVNGVISDHYDVEGKHYAVCLLYTSPSPRDRQRSRMPSSA